MIYSCDIVYSIRKEIYINMYMYVYVYVCMCICMYVYMYDILMEYCYFLLTVFDICMIGCTPAVTSMRDIKSWGQ